jgi:ephrin-B
MLVEEWLLDIKMDSYIHIFTQAGLTQLSDLAGLEDSDLQSIGVSLIGHRNKMLRTIRSLPITEETKKTPWNRAPSMKV